MAVKIRLTRMGDNHNAQYRIVVSDSRKARDGKYVDLLGTYNPNTNPATVKVDSEKTLQWIKNGAKPTDTAKVLLMNAGVIAKEAKVIKTTKKPKPEKKAKK